MCPALLQGHFIGRGSTFGDQIALLDHLSFFEIDANELAADLRLDGHHRQRRHRSQAFENNRNIAFDSGRDADRYRGGRGKTAARPRRRGRRATDNIPSGACDHGKAQADPDKGPQPIHRSIRPRNYSPA